MIDRLMFVDRRALRLAGLPIETDLVNDEDDPDKHLLCAGADDTGDDNDTITDDDAEDDDEDDDDDEVFDDDDDADDDDDGDDDDEDFDDDED